MAINIATFERGTPYQGNAPPAPTVPAKDNKVSVALGAESTVFAGPCEARVTADEKVRIAFASTPGAADPATSAIVIAADSSAWFTFPRGSWYAKAAAYS